MLFDLGNPFMRNNNKNMPHSPRCFLIDGFVIKSLTKALRTNNFLLNFLARRLNIYANAVLFKAYALCHIFVA